MRSLRFAAVVLAASAAAGSLPAQADLTFRHQQIEADFDIGYAVTTADINQDGKLDIVAINPTQTVWFENPTWLKHVILDGKTEKDNVCIAVNDINGDGRIDIALGAAWRPSDTKGGGTLQWITPVQDSDDPWMMYPIGFEPTLHRMRWADVDGDGKKELIIAPLHGRGTAGPEWWHGNGARLLIMRPPADATGKWGEEVADDSFHIVHNIWPVNFDDDKADEILTASYEGVHVLDRSSTGEWTRRKLGEGFQGDKIKGAGEIKLGRLKNGRRFLATIEPWHANQAVVYEEPSGGKAMWNRKVLTDQLDGGHAVWAADFDGDGDEEIAIGWRMPGKGEFAKPGVAVFDPVSGQHQIIDAGGMATEDLTAADLNADGRPDIIAAGRATHNVKIYWNEK